MTELPFKERFARDGYAIARELFAPEEVKELRDHYMKLRQSGTYPGDFDGVDPKSDDPVQRESTRIQAIGTFGGQGTYDPIQIKELIGGRAWEHPSVFKVFGVRDAEEALHPTPE